MELMAEYLSKLKLHKDRIEPGDNDRGRQATEIMAAHLRPADGTRQVAGLAPNDDVGPCTSDCQNESKSLMIVGHLLYLSRLLSALLGVQQDRTLVTFQTGGVLHLSAMTTESGGYRGPWFQSCC